MRKIKLMALLLAALMIVTAFAGCAGVKKEELDALDVRVQALEDLLNGQQKDLEEIKNDLAGLDNKEVLDAIDSMKTDLENQIKDVNTRVDDFEDKADAPIAGVSAETKAEQQKALALIEVKRAEFTKAVDEYSAEDYTKISEALGTATGAVNAATTVDAVKAAMTALDSELAKYMTYAMKAYDYYCKLLGNVNADAGDLVAEVKAFLKEVEAVYDGGKVPFTGKANGQSYGTSATLDEHEVELMYLVSEGSSETRDQYLNVYATLKALCTLYTSTSKTYNADGTTGATTIYYIEDGKVEDAQVYAVKGYALWAEDLVRKIDEQLGDNFIYASDNYKKFGADDGLYAQYETFVEGAAILGGDKLVNLVTNAAEVIAAEDTYKTLEEAASAFWTATRVKANDYQNVFYYYGELVKNNATQLLEYTVGTKTYWVADEYEKVEDIFADWVAEYELSEENIKAIIEKSTGKDNKTIDQVIKDFKFGTTAATDTYNLDKHVNALLVEAFNSFKTDIAGKIKDINEATQVSIDMVLAYDEVEELYADFIKLQEATTDKTVAYPENVAVTLSDDNFKVIVREADLFDNYSEDRIKVAFTTPKFTDPNGLLNLYTFEGDVDQLEENGVYFEDKNEDGIIGADEDNRAKGDIYDFFDNTYSKIKAQSKAINNEIKALAKAVAENKLANNQYFVDLKGEYTLIPEGYSVTVDGTKFTTDSTNPPAGANEILNKNVYAPIEKIYVGSVAYDNYLKSMPKAATTISKSTTVLTIAAFEYNYSDFAAMINIDELNAAEKAMSERIVKLFADANDILALVDAIDYVRVGSTSYTYVDHNENGKYDADDEDELKSRTELKTEPTRLVSLSDKANVDTAFAKYDAWTKLGGHVNMKQFTNYVDADEKVYADIFEMVTVKDPKKIDEATKLVRKLANQINDLEVLAYQFTEAVKNVKAVDGVNAFVVNLDRNDLYRNNASNTRYFAFTKFTKSTHDNALDNDGTYVGVKFDAPWNTDTFYTKVSDTNTGNSDLKDWVDTKSMADKENLLTATAKAYNDFVKANVKYVADMTNNYSDTKDDYYQVAEFEEYAAVTTALADYAKYDLLSVKGYLLKTIDSKYDELQKQQAQEKDAAKLAMLQEQMDAWKYLMTQVAGATTIGEVENYLYAFADEYKSIAIAASSVEAVSVNVFERLAEIKAK